MRCVFKMIAVSILVLVTSCSKQTSELSRAAAPDSVYDAAITTRPRRIRPTTPESTVWRLDCSYDDMLRSRSCLLYAKISILETNNVSFGFMVIGKDHAKYTLVPYLVDRDSPATFLAEGTAIVKVDDNEPITVKRANDKEVNFSNALAQMKAGKLLRMKMYRPKSISDMTIPLDKFEDNFNKATAYVTRN